MAARGLCSALLVLYFIGEMKWGKGEKQGKCERNVLERKNDCGNGR
jgi:hypothetical protein